MTAFQTPVDICNRGLQHIGAPKINPTIGFTEISASAGQCSFVYDKLRRAELRRNVWSFATRRAVIRPIDATTMLLQPTLLQGGVTYFQNSIVSDQQNNIWISRVPNNIDNDPMNSLTWEPYFGPLTVQAYDSGTTYFVGELVYTQVGDGNARVYISLENNNADVPATATQWDATVTYRQNQVVSRLGIPYMSLIDLNTNHQPPNTTFWATTFTAGTGSIKWLQIGGPEFPAGVGLAPVRQSYPLGFGPLAADGARNVLRVPNGYLRKAPQDPKAGSNSWLGAPTNAAYSDWVFESDYIVTRDANPIVFRFVADVGDVNKFDDMFCEGLGARIGMELCEPLTQSTAKFGIARDSYKNAIDEARTVNAIETGPEELPLDDYLACRM